MELKIRNGMPQKLIAAFLCSSVIILLMLIGFIITLFSGKFYEHIISFLTIFGSMILFIWVVFILVAFIFYKTIHITQEEISLRNGRTVVWLIKKEDLLECTYSKIFVNGKFYPEAGILYFKLKKTNAYARHSICRGLFTVENSLGVSFGNIKKIINLGYPITIKQ